MKFVGFVNKFVPCSIYIEPGVVTTEIGQVCVTRLAPGQPSNIDWFNEEHVVGLGAWLAGFHKASRLFAIEHPEIASKFSNSENPSYPFPTNMKPPALPKTSEHYGIIHNDFH